MAGLGGGSRVKIVSKLPPDPMGDLKPEALERQTVSYASWIKDKGLLEKGDRIMLLEQSRLSIQEVKKRLNLFCSFNKKAPILLKTACREGDAKDFQIRLAGELGALLVDGLLDGIWVKHPNMDEAVVNEVLLMILQAAGARITKTEYIACPSCGRTHFDILSRLKEIREATSHLITLKIGVMGCIVNGPGEMADADYGYVGAGPGKVSIYKGKEALIRNLPETEALGALIDLMKKEGDWIDPPEDRPVL